MYTPTQLSAIKIFGKKDLTEGCIVRVQSKYPSWSMYDDVIRKINEDEELTYNFYHISINHISKNKDDDMIFTILWHEPHLEDVFRVAGKKWLIITVQYNYSKREYIGITFDDNKAEWIWEPIEYNPTLSLLEQSEETLTQLISLFK